MTDITETAALADPRTLWLAASAFCWIAVGGYLAFMAWHDGTRADNE